MSRTLVLLKDKAIKDITNIVDVSVVNDICEIAGIVQHLEPLYRFILKGAKIFALFGDVLFVF